VSHWNVRRTELLVVVFVYVWNSLNYLSLADGRKTEANYFYWRWRFISKVFPSHSPAKWLPTPGSLRHTACCVLYVIQRHLSAPIDSDSVSSSSTVRAVFYSVPFQYYNYNFWATKPLKIYHNPLHDVTISTQVRQMFCWGRTAHEDVWITSSTWRKAPVLSATQNFRH